MSYSFPNIRVELESLRHQVVHAMMSHNAEVEEFIDKELRKAIDSMDIEKEITACIRSEIQACAQQAIRNFFSTSGSRKLIQNIIKDSLEKSVNENEDYW